MPDRALSDAERHPSAGAEGLAALRRLLEHPAAPAWNHTCGERLDGAGLAAVAEYAELVRDEPPRGASGEVPAWVGPFVERCLTTVPAHRHLGPGPRRLDELPTTSRSDLSGRVEAFVADDQSLDDLVVHATSGTGGPPIPILQDPVVVASAYPLIEAALALHGVEVPRRPRRVGWMVVADQRSTFVLASVSAHLSGGLTCKVNLRPDAWRSPDDRVAFLQACDPPVLTGDPVAFSTLADLAVTIRPVGLVSSAMALLPGLAERLTERFGCPVVDVYALTEAGPVAVALPDGSGHALVQPRLHVEVLRPDGTPCPPRVRGEITLTGGFNPFLPLLRYRTGDRAALEHRGRRPVLVGLEARAPVVLRDGAGERVNTIDVTTALRRFALPQYALHQAADGSVALRVRDLRPGDEGPLRIALAGVFGAGPAISVATLEADDEVAAVYSRG